MTARAPQREHPRRILSGPSEQPVGIQRKRPHFLQPPSAAVRGNSSYIWMRPKLSLQRGKCHKTCMSKSRQHKNCYTDLVAFAKTWHELVVQLIKVTQVTPTIERPAPGSKRTRLPFDHLKRPKTTKLNTSARYGTFTKILGVQIAHLCVTEEGIENLPHEDNRAQQQICNPDPENAWCQSVCQLQSVTASFVLWFQAPLILKQRS